MFCHLFERILIYSSDHQLNMLFSSPIVYMDGTFSKSPAHFMQIYIIHAILFDICKQYNSYLKTKLFILGLPCIFCLLVNKKSITYRHIFSELKQLANDRGQVFSPVMIMSDFETGVIPVIKSEVSDKCHQRKFSLVFHSFISSFLLHNILDASFTLHRLYIVKYNTWECNTTIHQMRI